MLLMYSDVLEVQFGIRLSMCIYFIGISLSLPCMRPKPTVCDQHAVWATVTHHGPGSLPQRQWPSFST